MCVPSTIKSAAQALTLFIFFSFLGPRLQAEVIDDSNFCARLFEKKSFTKEQSQLYKRTAFDLIFRKKRLGTPLVQKLETVLEETLQGESESGAGSDTSQSLNLIFTLGVQEPLDHLDEFQRQKNHYEFLSALIEEHYLSLRKLTRAKTIDHCRSLQASLEFSWEGLEKLLYEKNTLLWGKRYFEYLEVKKILDKSLNKTKIPWQVVRQPSLDQVYKWLNHPKIRHVILITHGKSPGEILDNHDSYYPPSFFEQLSLSLESLSLFSCHSQEAIQYYDLLTHLKKNKSAYKNRFMFGVRDNQIYDKKNIAPISVLKYFITGVDEYLYKHQASKFFVGSHDHNLCRYDFDLPQGASRRSDVVGILANEDLRHPSNAMANSKAIGRCQLTSPDLILTQGGLSVSLNQHFIGAVTAKSGLLSISFDCGLLKDDDENVLVLAHNRSYEDTRFDKLDFSVQIRSLQSSFEIQSTKNLFDEGDKYRKTVLRFSTYLSKEVGLGENFTDGFSHF